MKKTIGYLMLGVFWSGVFFTFAELKGYIETLVMSMLFLIAIAAFAWLILAVVLISSKGE